MRMLLLCLSLAWSGVSVGLAAEPSTTGLDADTGTTVHEVIAGREGKSEIEKTGGAEASKSAPKGLFEAIERGRVSLGLRYRVEAVDDDRLIAGGAGRSLDRALASTLRTQLGFSTADWQGLSAHLLVEDVTVVGGDSYNNKGVGGLANDHTDRAVVADPEITEISQAFLRFEPNDSVSLSVGRQELAYGGQRFIGPVGWRQNHQEFDAVNLRIDASKRLIVRGAYVDQVHTVTGAQQAMHSPLLNVAYSGKKIKLAGYGYWLDYDRSAQARLSSATFGARAKGEFSTRGTWAYEVELAEQSDFADNPEEFDLGYRALSGRWLAEGGRVGLRLGIEILEGDGRNGFRTPLATLHKFNGFADKFLATPANGLEDLFLTLSGKAKAVSWQVTAHQFRSDVGSSDYGDELDLVLSYRAPWGQQFAFKGALYEADTFSADTTKLMLWTQWSM